MLLLLSLRPGEEGAHPVQADPRLEEGNDGEGVFRELCRRYLAEVLIADCSTI